jgi:outer membrane protein
MMRTSICTLLCLFSAAALADAGKVLTLDEAVKLASIHQPTMRQAHATTDVKVAQQDEARAPLLPQISMQLTRGTRTNNLASGAVIGLSSAGTGNAANWHLINLYNPETIGAQQLIWDFDQTLGKWSAAREATHSQEDTEKATLLQVVLTARTAFFLARANRDLVQVARDTLKNQDAHLVQTKGFVQVGTQPEIALATAETNRANALVQLITAENAYEVAKATLNQAMGIEQSTNYDVSNDSLPPLTDEDAETDKLMVEAVAARPEFSALEHQLESQRDLRSSAFGGYFPSLSAQTNFTDNGTSLNNLTWNWNAALVLNWSLFSGLLTPAQVREQDANIASLEAQRDALRLQVRLGVEQARLAVRAAKTSYAAAQEALLNANDQLRLAEGRYQTGVGSIIELGDAQVAQTNAAAQKVQAEYSVASARAQLIQALGRP